MFNLEECKNLMNSRPRQNATQEKSDVNTTEQVASILQNDDSGAFQLNPLIPLDASTPVTSAQTNKDMSAIYEFYDSPVSLEIYFNGIDQLNQ